jgi:PAS domain S-box-containing protein
MKCGDWFCRSEIKAHPGAPMNHVHKRAAQNAAAPRRAASRVLPGDLRHLAAIVESSDDAIISKNLDGIILSWNKAAERILGYPAKEIVGKSILTVIPPELHGDEAMILSKIRAGKRIEHFQTQRMHKNGSRVEVSLTISPVKDAQGKIIGAGKILRDITQQKRLEAALQTSERLASAGRLAATIAHEINNPLAAVTNFTYLAAQQADLSPQSRHYLTMADQELRRVAHIAQQTLGFYRGNAEPSDVPVQAAMDSLLNIYQSKLKSKSLRVDCTIEDGLAVFASEGELKQMLSNLLSNAIDACQPGGRITVRAQRLRNAANGRPSARITVADNGPGIPAQIRPRLFRPFFTTKKDVGTGLGLWITKDLITKNGGSIQVRTRIKPPTWTAMSIFLPIAPHIDSAG